MEAIIGIQHVHVVHLVVIDYLQDNSRDVFSRCCVWNDGDASCRQAWNQNLTNGK